MEKKMTELEAAREHFNLWWIKGNPTADSSKYAAILLAEIDRLGPAISASPQPRCPKCGSKFIVLGYNVWVDDGERSQHNAMCRECEYELTYKSTPADFQAFFAPAPAQEPPVVRCHTCKSTLIYKPEAGEIVIYHTCNPKPAPQPSIDELLDRIHTGMTTIVDDKKFIAGLEALDILRKRLAADPSVAGTQPAADEISAEDLIDRATKRISDSGGDVKLALLKSECELAGAELDKQTLYDLAEHNYNYASGAAQATPQVEEIAREIDSILRNPAYGEPETIARISSVVWGILKLEHLPGAPAQPGPEETATFFDECEYCHATQQPHDEACPKYVEPETAAQGTPEPPTHKVFQKWYLNTVSALQHAIDDPGLDQSVRQRLLASLLDLTNQWNALKAAQNGQVWVSVKESGLPRTGEWCWVVIGRVVQRQAAYLSSGRWNWADEDADTAPQEVVTHYQYMAAPPTGDAQTEKKS
jgi:hypothetical protein